MATLQKLSTGEIFSIDKGPIEIGREADNFIVVDDPTVSARHAVIIVKELSHNDNVEHILEDLDSTNHTYVNNIQVFKHSLKNGDIVRIGNTRFKFSAKSQFLPASKFTNKTQKIRPGSTSTFLYTK